MSKGELWVLFDNTCCRVASVGHGPDGAHGKCKVRLVVELEQDDGTKVWGTVKLEGSMRLHRVWEAANRYSMESQGDDVLVMINVLAGSTGSPGYAIVPRDVFYAMIEQHLFSQIAKYFR